MLIGGDVWGSTTTLVIVFLRTEWMVRWTELKLETLSYKIPALVFPQRLCDPPLNGTLRTRRSCHELTVVYYGDVYQHYDQWTPPIIQILYYVHFTNRTMVLVLLMSYLQSTITTINVDINVLFWNEWFSLNPVYLFVLLLWFLNGN